MVDDEGLIRRVVNLFLKKMHLFYSQKVGIRRELLTFARAKHKNEKDQEGLMVPREMQPTYHTFALGRAI